VSSLQGCGLGSADYSNAFLEPVSGRKEMNIIPPSLMTCRYGGSDRYSMIFKEAFYYDGSALRSSGKQRDVRPQALMASW